MPDKKRPASPPPEAGEIDAPEEVPAEDAPTEEAPAEKAALGEEAAAEKASAGKVSAEEAPVEEAPVEKAPVEKAPVEKVASEETAPEESPLRARARSQVVVAALLALLGFATVTQVRSSQADDTYAGLREQDLIEILNDLTNTSQRARREISRLEETRAELQSETSARQAALEDAKSRAQTLNILAGRVPVTGPGLRITITERQGTVSVGSLLDVVEELRTAGAEAMEVDNRVRLVAQSSFALGLEGIELDGQDISSPYLIDVIGEPGTLHGALTFRNGPIQTLKEFDGASVQVQEMDAIDIASVVEDPADDGVAEVDQ